MLYEGVWPSEPRPPREEICSTGQIFLPGFRGQGIGAALLDALIEHACGQGLPALSLCTNRATNVNALRLYERAGFVKVAEVPDTAGEGIVMRLLLIQ
jgi:ribosomal protein S18 acetylase RimI-like enzyme